MYYIPFISDWGFVCVALCMNPIRSAPTIRYNSAPHQQVVQKIDLIQSVPFRLRYETLPNLALIIGWLQCKWSWSIAWQIDKGNNKYGGRNEIILARNSVIGLFSRLRVNTHTPKRFLYRIQESDPAWKVIRSGYFSLSDFRDSESKFTANALPVFRSALFDLHAQDASECQKSLSENQLLEKLGLNHAY